MRKERLSTTGRINKKNESGQDSERDNDLAYSNLLNSLPHPIIIHLNGRVVFANDVTIEVTGYNNEEIIGMMIGEVLNDPTGTRKENPFLKLENALPSEQEYEIRTENRKFVIKNFLIKNSRIIYKGVEAVMTILIDITERKLLEKYLLGRLVETEEKARKQFAADIHDDLGPTLSSIKLHLGLLEQTKDPEKGRETLGIANDLLTEVISKMRLIANNLMPRLIENYGLEAAVNSFITTIPKKGHLTIELESNLGNRRFPKQTELHLYRILCELINNTIKHSDATEASVRMHSSKSQLKLYYSDNGKGYKVEEINPLKSGMGVSNIVQRVSLIDGKIQFMDKNGRTEVSISKLL